MSYNAGWGPHPGHSAPQWAGGWIPPAPQPGVIPLRPLDVGEMIGGAFTALRRYWKPLVGVVLAVQGTGFLLAIAAVVIAVLALPDSFSAVFDPAPGQRPDGAEVTDVVLALLPGGLLLMFVMLAGTAVIGALCPAVVQEAVLGRTATFRSMWRRSWSRMPSVLGVVLLIGLIAGGPVLLIYAIGFPLALTTWDGSGPPAAFLLVIAGALAWMPVAVWLMTRFSLAPATAVFEGLGPVDALRRSARLVGDSWWRVFGITLLAYAIGMIGGYTIQMPFGLVGVLALFPALLGAGAGGGDVAPLVFGVVVYSVCLLAGVVVSALFQMVYPQLAVSLLYVDQRMRKEHLAAALVMAAQPAQAPGPGPGPGWGPGPASP
ncbi:hypothetical protein ACFY7H_14765 [Streptomyces sp. NPDC012794]|uniref:DUF7544 domain-containing protein n=1 Tax=Streptomyces sp. NPDC012794 TaxID=3364850 RepID=UPI00367E0D25